MSFNWNMDPLSVVSRYSDKLSYVPFAPESATSIRCHVRSVTPSWKRWCAPFEANEHDEVRSVDFKATRLSSISRDSIYAALNKKPSLFNYVNLRHYRENFLAPALDQNRPQKEGTLGHSSVNESIITYICTYIHTYVCVYIYIYKRIYSHFAHSRIVCRGGLFGDRREMPGIRIGMAGNDGSWFATFRLGLGRRFASCDLYTRYIPATHPSTLPLGFHVTYVATWREKTIFENISLLPAHRCRIPFLLSTNTIGSSKFVLPTRYYSSFPLIHEKYSGRNCIVDFLRKRFSSDRKEAGCEKMYRRKIICSEPTIDIRQRKSAASDAVCFSTIGLRG